MLKRYFHLDQLLQDLGFTHYIHDRGILIGQPSNRWISFRYDLSVTTQDKTFTVSTLKGNYLIETNIPNYVLTPTGQFTVDYWLEAEKFLRSFAQTAKLTRLNLKEIAA
jgi:hypothetical protein